MTTQKPEQKILDEIFPLQRTDAFFDALYGDAEDGAYDIHLICEKVEPQMAVFNFELRKRKGKCLRCNLTYGLPEVFKKHPVINVAEVAKELAQTLGWEGSVQWKLKPVKEISNDLHIIPFEIEQK